jgi:hypothetical protein
MEPKSMTVLRTELDALLERLREDKADPTGKNRNAVARDCWRMFEDLASQFKEESAMRDRYKRQSNSWMNKAFEIDAVKETLLDAVEDALAFLDRPDITTYEWYKLAPDHVAKFRRAIAKACYMQGISDASDALLVHAGYVKGGRTEGEYEQCR